MEARQVKTTNRKKEPELEEERRRLTWSMDKKNDKPSSQDTEERERNTDCQPGTPKKQIECGQNEEKRWVHERLRSDEGRVSSYHPTELPPSLNTCMATIF
jgi:hypothetical protein